MRTLFCQCGNLRSKSHAYCPICKAEYQREWRKTEKKSREEKWKESVRSTAHGSLRRGKIEKKNACAICGNNGTQMHHPDYSQPLLVVWVCRECHENIHSLEAMENKLRAHGKIK